MLALFRSLSILEAGSLVRASLHSLMSRNVLSEFRRLLFDAIDTKEKYKIAAISPAYIVTAKKKTKIGRQSCLQDVALLLQKLHMHWQHQQSAVNPPSTIAPNFINKKLRLLILSTDLNA